MPAPDRREREIIHVRLDMSSPKVGTGQNRDVTAHLPRLERLTQRSLDRSRPVVIPNSSRKSGLRSLVLLRVGADLGMAVLGELGVRTPTDTAGSGLVESLLTSLPGRP